MDERWIKRFHPAPGAPARVVLLPHAGGAASAYFKLSAALHPALDAHAVQYPGRQERRHEPPLTDVRRLAAAVADALPGDDRPTVLFGHSMGAVVAFELALLLERRGAAPHALVASGRRAPSTYRDEWVHRRDRAGVAAELRGLSGTDPVFLQDPELFEMVLPALRADYRAVETYECDPGAAVGCRLVAFVGDDDPKTTVEEAGAWSRHTTGGFDLRVFPGGHFYLDDQVAEVTDALIALAG
ncbi:thioesterase II family protein [Bailinhaonella thermotolerans]|uniref:Thioesterase n=1 Tax=Bailinhaonella thermotolerans TaxID=1070861 RepID=A0A3A4A0D6_9ACTN|nr:alpha/beta fold hydrolase [Bailinhaonella thermotolerans]RJL20157.1 thioesterase [Bailinhaonella thermotolerans]